MTDINSNKFYETSTPDVQALTTSTAAADITTTALSIKDAESFHWTVNATGGTALNADNYIQFKKITFGNDDFSKSTDYSLTSGADYILVKGDIKARATILKLTAAGGFEVGITNLKEDGYTKVRLVYSIVGDAPNIIHKAKANIYQTKFYNA
jgi:hypothetical protein